MKNLDFEDFKKVCYLLKSEEEFRSSSRLEKVFKQIVKIKSGMNLNRKLNDNIVFLRTPRLKKINK